MNEETSLKRRGDREEEKRERCTFKKKKKG